MTFIWSPLMATVRMEPGTGLSVKNTIVFLEGYFTFKYLFFYYYYYLLQNCLKVPSPPCRLKSKVLSLNSSLSNLENGSYITQKPPLVVRNCRRGRNPNGSLYEQRCFCFSNKGVLIMLIEQNSWVANLKTHQMCPVLLPCHHVSHKERCEEWWQ